MRSRKCRPLFARNLEMFAELTEQLLEQDQVKAIRRIRQLRDQLNAGFQAVTAQADAVLFEFGPSRPRKLQIREDVRRWQPSIRALLQVQITSVQYLAHKPLSSLPEPIAQAGVAFEKDIALVMHAMASEVKREASRWCPRHPRVGRPAAGGNSTSTTRTPVFRSRPRHPMCWALLRVSQPFLRRSTRTSAIPSPLKIM